MQSVKTTGKVYACTFHSHRFSEQQQTPNRTLIFTTCSTGSTHGVVLAYRNYSYTASDTLVKLKSRALMPGTTLPPTSTGRLSISTLASTLAGLSFQRKFIIGYAILPFSTMNKPSR